MKKLILDFLIWVAMLAALIIGNLYAIPSLVVLTSLFYWISVMFVIVAAILMNVYPEILDKVKFTIPLWKRIYITVLNIIILSVLLYFQYAVLPIFVAVSAVLEQILITKTNNACKINTSSTTK